MSNGIERVRWLSQLAKGWQEFAAGSHRLALFLLVPAAVLAGSVAGCGRAADCEGRDLLAEAASPDGKRVASLYSNVCAAGMVTSTSVTAEVRAAGRRPPVNPGPGVVFGMEDFGPSSRADLKLEWKSADQLLVTVPNEAWIGTQLAEFDGVAVAYRYQPDDPASRRCLKEWLASSSLDKPTNWPAAKAKCLGARGTDTAR
jgi:hypothetical protein